MDETDDRTESERDSRSEWSEHTNNSAADTDVRHHPNVPANEQQPTDGASNSDAPPVEDEYLGTNRSEDDSDSNVAGSLDRLEPLEPQEINLENAAFVLLGVLLVVGFLLGALLGL